jgi:hypothetical protein
LKTFALTPLGRMKTVTTPQTFDASQYPTTPNVNLDGTANDAVHALYIGGIPGGVGSI